MDTDALSKPTEHAAPPGNFVQYVLGHDLFQGAASDAEKRPAVG